MQELREKIEEQVGHELPEAVTEARPDEDILFTEGEVVMLRGVPCELQRINRSSLVFRPLSDPDIGPAWRVVRDITT